jgi:hypothetical protein
MIAQRKLNVVYLSIVALTLYVCLYVWRYVWPVQVFDRYASRFNIVHVACALSCLADKTAPWLAHRPPPRAELSALRTFTAQLLTTAGQQLPSIDAATAAALLHSLARLAGTGQVGGLNLALQLGSRAIQGCRPSQKVHQRGPG